MYQFMLVQYDLFLCCRHVNAGAGASHIQSLFAALNIPSMHHKTLAVRKSEISGHIQHVATEACQSALQEEKYIVTEKLDAQQSSDIPLSVITRYIYIYIYSKNV